MQMTRRDFMRCNGGALALSLLAGTRSRAAEADARCRLSACDWSLQMADPSALEIAKGIGLDGIEASAGEPADTLRVADAAYRQQYKDAMAATGLVVSSLAMGLLNEAPLATDPRASAWLEQTIAAAADLNAKVVLLAFFGKGDLRRRTELKEAEMAAVVDRVKAVAPLAREKGVVLGLENTLSGEDNLRILDRIGSDAVRVYYDVGNSTYNGYDVPGELRALGDRICQIHFKDGAHYLGEGKVDMPAIAEAIAAIGYRGWIVLETAIPSKDRDADFKRNAAFTRKLLGMA